METIKRLDSSYLFQNYGREELCFERGEGEFLYDVEGDRYLDLVAGIAVNALGHCHPEVMDAIWEQANKLWHVSNLYYIQEQARLGETISSLLPSPLERSLFVNSGAEAIEAALKLVLKHTGRGRMVSASNSFHGRTAGALSATGQSKYHQGFEPLLSSAFDFVDFGDEEGLKDAVGQDTAAVILEPVQGEGGIITSRPEFFRTARELCDDHGALLVMDEVQTGFGRTGRMFGFEHFGIVPDVVTLAKAMGGGFPIGAVVSSGEISDSFGPGTHGATFGGSPLACAVANTVISTISNEKLHLRAAQLGQEWIDRLKGITGDSAVNVRGKGLMIGMDMGDQAKPFHRYAMQEGILVNVCAGSVVRMVPPLVIRESSTFTLDACLHSFLSGE
ncbi:MAG: aspartate aminotransferase family protein [Methanomassiliicoccales archaeon]